MVINYIWFLGGLVLLLASAEQLVRNATRLSSVLGQSRLFIGLTLTAFGTSAPELAIGLTGMVEHSSDIGLGNIVGSNIFNIFVVLGLTALLKPIVVKNKTVIRDVPVLILISLLFFLLILDGGISILESLILLAILITYLIYLSRSTKDAAELIPELVDADEKSKPAGWGLVRVIVMIVVSIVMLIVSSRWMIDSAINIASSFGISEFMIGLTILAIGTSLPEIATSLIALKKNEHDLAIGNVLGSCLFNIIAIPSAMTLYQGGTLAVNLEAVYIDVPIMIFAALACLPIFFSDHRISRKEGLLFLFYYTLYSLSLYFRYQSHSGISDYTFHLAMIAVPVAVITFSMVTFKAIRYHRHNNLSGDK